MAFTINLNLILLGFFLLLINCGRSSQRPSDPIPTSMGPSNPVVNLPTLTDIESLPAVRLLRNFLLRQNQIADAMIPIMVRALASPVPGLADALERSMTLFGVTSYLLGPSLARSARSLSPVVEPIVGPTDSIVKGIDHVSELESLFEHVLTLLGLNNDECKEALACRAGQAVAHDYPVVSSYLTSATSSLRPDDRFSKQLIEAMSSNNTQCAAVCPNLVIIEKYWKESRENDLKSVARKAFDDTLGETITSLISEARNLEAQAINSNLLD